MVKMDAEDKADAKKGIKQTPAEEKTDYMGHQGSPATITPAHSVPKPTGKTLHRANKKGK